MKFKTKIEKKEKSIVEVRVVMDFSEVENKKEEALKLMSKDIKIDGFRQGKVPQEVIEKHLGEQAVLQEAAQLVINDVFPEILEKEKLKMIGYPAISVTKLAPANDFEFKIEMTVYPEVKLPDYKKIAGKIKKEVVKVTPEDFKKMEENVLNVYNKQQESLKSNQKEDDEKNKKEKETKFSPQATKLTDEIVKTFGPFKNVAEFKKAITHDLEHEKEHRAIEKQRGQISEALLKELKIEVPEMLINVELDKMIAYVKDEAQKYGIK